VTPAGPLTLCPDTVVLLVSSRAVNYQWFWNGAAIQGSTGDSLTVTTSGSYAVATGSAGCGSVGSLSATVAITYLDQLVPVITMVNGVLVSNWATGNQWYLNGSIIQGALHQQFTPSAPGSYTVRVENGIQTVDTSTFQIGVGGCWSQYSLPYIITDSVYITPDVLVYPNPAINVLTLSNRQSGPVTVRIFNLLGQAVFEGQGVVGTVLVDVGRWSKGAYFVLVIDERTKQQEKVVVLRL
jgi:Secretion system C-terminal sorting domain